MKSLRAILFIIATIFSLNTLAFEFNQIEDIQLKLELTTSLLKANERIAQKYEIEPNKENLSKNFILSLERELRKESEKLLRQSAKLEAGPTLQESRLQGFIQKVNWKGLASNMASKLGGLRNYIRKQGFFYVGYALFTNVLQFTIPSLLIAADLNLLGFVAFYILGDLPAYLYYKVGYNIYYRQKMFRLFGGKEKYIEFKKIDREVKKTLNLSAQDDLLLPIDANRVISLKNEGMMKKLIGRMGFDNDSLSIRKMKSFLKEESLLSATYSSLLNNDKISEQMRLAMVILEMQKDDQSLANLKFKTKFSKYFTTIQDTSDLSDIYDWTQKMIKAKDLDELRSLSKEIPQTLQSAEQYMLIWQEVILPRLAQRKDIFSFNQYRKLTGSFQVFKVKIYKNQHPIHSPEFTEALERYLSKSFDHIKVNCGEKIDTFIGKVVNKYKN
ncbi:hypothetical protein [Bacteriovorax sp. DB6_IX]|uniref:hypothetical protein n=1 Tax=Bacteriovorax sp. DB6_IX TaxID=1353530 RepID=UPI00038A41FF|nr:hypothetical protein [Bacteriovorax sp. DB6_IX]EQC49679.1 hypothetical protein M901_2383 [Bacteriovorax sp. DB6_IX]